jgi:hypothetical protein
MIMKSSCVLAHFCIISLLLCSSCAEKKSPFEFSEDSQGVSLYEAGNPVFSYQREPKSLDGRFVCNNYFHPLYTIDGDTLTEEFPASHPHQRGVYWAWHQVYINDQSVGSSWMMNNLSHDIFDLQTEITDTTARLNLDIHWKSSQWENNRQFLHEKTSVTVHRMVDEVRKIDFEISMKALVPGVSVGGSDNELGYGGFSLRIKTPEDMVFTSDRGLEIYERGQTRPIPWMDFSGSFGSDGEFSGITVLSHPSSADYPPVWILNPRSSMQNPVYPGRYRTELPVDTPVVLRYRLIIHKGNLREVNVPMLKMEYDQALL